MFFDTSAIDLIHDTRYLCARPLGLMGQKQCRVVFQGANNLVVVQNVKFEFRQVVRPYYFLGDIYGRYYF